jgi:hypothetical protein
MHPVWPSLTARGACWGSAFPLALGGGAHRRLTSSPAPRRDGRTVPGVTAAQVAAAAAASSRIDVVAGLSTLPAPGSRLVRPAGSGDRPVQEQSPHPPRHVPQPGVQPYVDTGALGGPSLARGTGPRWRLVAPPAARSPHSAPDQRRRRAVDHVLGSPWALALGSGRWPTSSTTASRRRGCRLIDTDAAAAGYSEAPPADRSGVPATRCWTCSRRGECGCPAVGCSRRRRALASSVGGSADLPADLCGAGPGASAGPGHRVSGVVLRALGGAAPAGPGPRVGWRRTSGPPASRTGPSPDVEVSLLGELRQDDGPAGAG